MTSEASPSVRVARGTSYLLIRSAVGELMALIYFILAARIFSVAEIGAISALNMVVATFAILGMFAIPSAATKFVSEYVGRNRLDVAKGVYTKVLVFGLLASVSLSVLCFAFSTVVSSIVFGSQGYQLLINILALDVFAALLSSFLIGVLFGLQKFKEVALFGIANNCATYGSALYLLFGGYGLTGLMWAWVIGDFVSLGLVSFVASTSFRTKATPHPLIKLVRYSFPLYLSNLLNFLSIYIDRFIVLFFAGLTSLGVYGMVIMAVGVVLLVSNAIGNTLFPQFSELHGGYGRDSLKQASVRASGYVFLVYVPLAVGLAATAYPVITLFMGLQYGSGWLPLAILSLATALACGGIVVNSVLLSLGATRAFFGSQCFGDSY